MTSPGGMSKGVMNRPQNLLATGDMILDGWDCDLALLDGQKGWLKAVGDHGRGHSCSRAGQRVMGILHQKEKRGPGSGMMGRDEANGWSPDSGWLFPWTIGLRMITRSESGGSTKRLTKKPA